jgi:hypothetical protein
MLPTVPRSSCGAGSMLSSSVNPDTPSRSGSRTTEKLKPLREILLVSIPQVAGPTFLPVYLEPNGGLLVTSSTTQRMPMLTSTLYGPSSLFTTFGTSSLDDDPTPRAPVRSGDRPARRVYHRSRRNEGCAGHTSAWQRCLTKVLSAADAVRGALARCRSQVTWLAADWARTNWDGGSPTWRVKATLKVLDEL